MLYDYYYHSVPVDGHADAWDMLVYYNIIIIYLYVYV